MNARNSLVYRGFTLVEFLVVIAITAIPASLLFPSDPKGSANTHAGTTKE
jgi:prepilin-type N-terminal cleavage/methylation domain-containing protein